VRLGWEPYEALGDLDDADDATLRHYIEALEEPAPVDHPHHDYYEMLSRAGIAYARRVLAARSLPSSEPSGALAWGAERWGRWVTK
jgi:hypothetical protein